jgi:hypothetical protein
MSARVAELLVVAGHDAVHVGDLGLLGAPDEPWERQALSDIRLGRAEEAVAAYLAHDRIHHNRGPDVVRDRMIDDWWTATSDGVDALMLAAHYRQVDALNQRARQRVRAAGRLGERELQLGGRAYAVGDTVLALRNDYRQGLLNGTRGTISAIERPARALVVTTDDGATVTIPFAYAAAGNLTHGHAMTIHKAEGATVDIGLVLADETMTREQLYTAMSRGQQQNVVYLATDEVRTDLAHAIEATREPVEVLVGIIDITEAKHWRSTPLASSCDLSARVVTDAISSNTHPACLSVGDGKARTISRGSGAPEARSRKSPRAHAPARRAVARSPHW